MKKLALLLVVASLFMASPVMAYTGEFLLKACTQHLEIVDGKKSENILDKSDLDSLIRLGYIGGINDTIRAFDSLLRDNNDPDNPFVNVYCLPEKPNETELIRAIVKHLKEHPKGMNFYGSINVINALREAFPCNGITPIPDK